MVIKHIIYKTLQNEFYLSQEQILTIEKFTNEILNKNKIINLISRKDEKNIYEKHILDSLQFLKLLRHLKISTNNLKIIDIGSGGGFPAIILSIALPSMSFILSESSKKKYSFLLWLKNFLNLKNVEIINKRLSNKEVLTEKFDIATERAAGKINKILPLMLKLIKPDGWAIVWQNLENIIEIKKTKEPYFIYNYCKETEKLKRALFVFKNES